MFSKIFLSLVSLGRFVRAPPPLISFSGENERNEVCWCVFGYGGDFARVCILQITCSALHCIQTCLAREKNQSSMGKESGPLVEGKY